MINHLADEFRFFHPHVAFPQIFGTRESPRAGARFDVVLGNPPWDKVKLFEREFFAVRAPAIASAAGSRRMALISGLATDDPHLWNDYRAALRAAEAESNFLRASERFPLCGRGDVNTYAVFAEAMRELLNSKGRMGAIVPSGIATDDTTNGFFVGLWVPSILALGAIVLPRNERS